MRPWVKWEQLINHKTSLNGWIATFDLRTTFLMHDESTHIDKPPNFSSIDQSTTYFGHHFV